jgi:hypothetical protein
LPGLDLQFSEEEREFFFAFTTMTTSNGLTASFWEDRWIHGRSVREIAPTLCLHPRASKQAENIR